MIEVLKQALEALETEVSIDWTNNDEFNASAEKMHDAITSLRQAIAELESQKQGEPVAWLLTGNAPLFAGEIMVHMSKPKWIPEWWRAEPLYTHPPQRTWVGLTDEEIEEGIKQSWVTEQAFQSAAWWAEAKLKEKNT